MLVSFHFASAWLTEFVQNGKLSETDVQWTVKTVKTKLMIRTKPFYIHQFYLGIFFKRRM